MVEVNPRESGVMFGNVCDGLREESSDFRILGVDVDGAQVSAARGGKRIVVVGGQQKKVGSFSSGFDKRGDESTDRVTVGFDSVPFEESF